MADYNNNNGNNGTNNGGNGKRYPSPFWLSRGVDMNNNPIIVVTGVGRPIRPEGPRTVQGRNGPTEVYSCRMPVTGRNDELKEFTGVEPSVDKDGTIWVQLSFFGKLGERFQKVISTYKDPVFVINGTLSVRQHNGYNNVNVLVRNFDVEAPSKLLTKLENAPTAGGGNWGQYQAPQQTAQQQSGWGQQAAPQQAPQQNWGQPQQAAPQQNSGWGQQAPQQTAPQQQGGWGQPQQAAPQQNWGAPSGFQEIPPEEDGDLPF